MATKETVREVWLAKAITKLRPFFSSKGYNIPERVRVSCGWPSTRSLASKKRAIGEAWSSKDSRSKHFEIFVSPYIAKSTTALSVLAHELVHVTVGLECGHKGKFIECAHAVGLDGPMTATGPSDALMQRLNGLVKTLGEYPHATLDGMSNHKKKQKGRLIKVGCPTCQYTTRIAMSWIIVAIPTCPNPNCPDEGREFEVELPPNEEAEE
jgi:hypothetical protein